MSFPLSIPMGKRHFLFYDVLLPIAGILLIGKLLALRFDGPIFHRLDSVRAFGLGYWFAHSEFRTALWNASGYIFALIPAFGWAAWIRLNFEFDRAKGTFRLDRPIYRGSVSALRWFRRVALPRFRKTPSGGFPAVPDAAPREAPETSAPVRPAVAPSLPASAPSLPAPAAGKPARPAPDPVVIAPLRAESAAPRLTLDPNIRPELPARPDASAGPAPVRAVQPSPLADFAARLESARSARSAAPEAVSASRPGDAKPEAIRIDTGKIDAALSEAARAEALKSGMAKAGPASGAVPAAGTAAEAKSAEKRAAHAAAGADSGNDDVMPPVPGASQPPPARPIAPGPAYPRRAR